MAVDMNLWRGLVIDEVRSVADEDFQRQVWFGSGDGGRVDSPTEQFCAFFDNASVPEFLARPDNGLSEEQASKLAHLTGMMDELADSSPDVYRPEYLIDDPRWQAIRKQAKTTLDLLLRGS